MNLFINWGYDVNSEGFDHIIKSLKVERCFYSADNIRDHGKIDAEFIHIDLDWGLEKFLENELEMEPLDGKLLEDMRFYESTAMDILYRWRRSITTDNSYKNIKQVYKIYLKYWNDFIIKENINMVILFNVPHIPSLFIIYALAKIYNIPVVIIKYFALVDERYHKKFLSSELYGMDKDFEQRLKKFEEKYNKYSKEEIILKEELEEYFVEYKKENVEIRRVIFDSSRKKYKEKISLMFNRGLMYLRKKKYKILMKKIWYLIKLRFISFRILNYIEKKEIEPDYNKKFVFFPLHCQPEASTLPLAGRFEDQLLIIKMLRKSLPKDIFIFVKEHPAYWKVKDRNEGIFESRDINFYDKITKIENVKLIKHEHSSLDLMDKCEFIVTATGSAALEAILKGIPVLIFSDFVYSFFPGAYKIDSNHTCNEAVNEILTKRFYKDEKKIRVFFKALEEDFFQVGVMQGLVEKVEGYEMSLEESSRVTGEKIVDYIRRKYTLLIGDKNGKVKFR